MASPRRRARRLSEPVSPPSVDSTRHTASGDALVVAGGLGLAVGALLLMDDAAPSAWAIAPPVVAVLTLLHVRLMVAPGGPMRT